MVITWMSPSSPFLLVYCENKRVVIYVSLIFADCSWVGYGVNGAVLYPGFVDYVAIVF